MERMSGPAKIVTENPYPPIPDRRFDWLAYRDGYEPPDCDGVGGGPVGWGATEAEAIADLLRIEWEDMDGAESEAEYAAAQQAEFEADRRRGVS